MTIPKYEPIPFTEKDEAYLAKLPQAFQILDWDEIGWFKRLTTLPRKLTPEFEARLRSLYIITDDIGEFSVGLKLIRYNCSAGVIHAGFTIQQLHLEEWQRQKRNPKRGRGRPAKRRKLGRPSNHEIQAREARLLLQRTMRQVAKVILASGEPVTNANIQAVIDKVTMEDYMVESEDSKTEARIKAILASQPRKGYYRTEE